MTILRMAIIGLFSLIIVSCQGVTNTPVKSGSTATTIHDVIAAWDAHCADYNFHPCPPEAATSACLVTVGMQYYGTEFDVDIVELINGMKDELASDFMEDPEVDDLLNSILTNHSWY